MGTDVAAGLEGGICACANGVVASTLEAKTVAKVVFTGFISKLQNWFCSDSGKFGWWGGRGERRSESECGNEDRCLQKEGRPEGADCVRRRRSMR